MVELGLRPDQIDQLTYNELLALVYHHRKQVLAENYNRRRLAFDVSKAVNNLFRKPNPLGFDDLFPDPFESDDVEEEGMDEFVIRSADKFSKLGHEFPKDFV
jgi:hypothetical protein